MERGASLGRIVWRGRRAHAFRAFLFVPSLVVGTLVGSTQDSKKTRVLSMDFHAKNAHAKNVFLLSSIV